MNDWLNRQKINKKENNDEFNNKYLLYRNKW